MLQLEQRRAGKTLEMEEVPMDFIFSGQLCLFLLLFNLPLFPSSSATINTHLEPQEAAMSVFIAEQPQRCLRAAFWPLFLDTMS